MICSPAEGRSTSVMLRLRVNQLGVRVSHHPAADLYRRTQSPEKNRCAADRICAPRGSISHEEKGCTELRASRSRHETFKAHGKSVSVGEVLDAIWYMYRAHRAPLAKFHAKNFVSRALQAKFPAPPGTLKDGVARWAQFQSTSLEPVLGADFRLLRSANPAEQRAGFWKSRRQSCW